MRTFSSSRPSILKYVLNFGDMLACQSVFGDGDNCNSSSADKHLQQKFHRAESHAKTGDYAGTLLTGQQCSDRGLTSEINSTAQSLYSFRDRRILTIKGENDKVFNGQVHLLQLP